MRRHPKKLCNSAQLKYIRNAALKLISRCNVANFVVVKNNYILIIMRTSILLSTLFTIFISSTAIAQEEISREDLMKRIEILEAEQTKPKLWETNFYGYIRTDYSFDSRQSAYSREYNLNLYPLDEKTDRNGEDINAAASSNFLSITSRVGLKFRGPDVWGAKATGQIEADFFGNTELNKSVAATGSTGLLRLRHAAATLTWPKTTITLGQTWYPTYIPEVSPGVGNFNSSMMFNPFGWAGQIKLVQQLTPELNLNVVAYKDREFQAPNALGASANSATFNSLMPTLHGQLQYHSKKILAGAGAEYQSLKPVLESAGLKSDEKVNSAAFFGYFKYADEKVIAKLYGITGGNLHHFVMLGGFAGYAEPNGQESYQATKTTSAWIDLASANPKIAPGAFFGYTKNAGVDAGFQNLYMRGAAGARIIDDVWRASARIDFKQNKFNISPEIEYTAARWGDTNTSATADGNMKNVANVRGLIRVMYSL